nr:potassium channel family protein [Shewanella benthica]
MAYFSFVTLTTLGYGDISPISPFSQVLVYMEAIAGVFYMAIVVASLVSSNQGKQHG